MKQIYYGILLALLVYLKLNENQTEKGNFRIAALIGIVYILYQLFQDSDSEGFTDTDQKCSPPSSSPCQNESHCSPSPGLGGDYCYYTPADVAAKTRWWSFDFSGGGGATNDDGYGNTKCSPIQVSDDMNEYCYCGTDPEGLGWFWDYDPKSLKCKNLFEYLFGGVFSFFVFVLVMVIAYRLTVPEKRDRWLLLCVIVLVVTIVVRLAAESSDYLSDSPPTSPPVLPAQEVPTIIPGLANPSS